MFLDMAGTCLNIIADPFTPVYPHTPRVAVYPFAQRSLYKISTLRRHPEGGAGRHGLEQKMVQSL